MTSSPGSGASGCFLDLGLFISSLIDFILPHIIAKEAPAIKAKQTEAQKIRDENEMELALGGKKEINTLPKWEPK